MTQETTPDKYFRFAGAAAALLCGLVFGIPAGAQTASAGSHPDYGQAYSDLNAARSLLNVPGKSNVTSWEKVAVRNIDKAMYEIVRAAKGGGYTVTIPVADSAGGQGQLQQALALEQSARTALQPIESSKKAAGWCKVAVYHVESSMKMVDTAIRNSGG